MFNFFKTKKSAEAQKEKTFGELVDADRAKAVAIKAREISHEKTKKFFDLQQFLEISQINDAIREAAAKGQFEITKHITNSRQNIETIRKVYEGLGFTASYTLEYEHEYPLAKFKISW